MNAIEKLRIMTNWFNEHNEHFCQQFKTISQLEDLYDYSIKNNIPFLDDDYLYGGEVSDEERIKFYKFLTKIKKL